MNSSVIDLIVNNHYRYVGGASVPAPKYLEIEDIPAVLSSGALFAEKYQT